MYATSSNGAHSKITEMYNRMVLSEGPAAVEALRKKCERWQGSSIPECTTTTTPPQLITSVLVERVNTLLSTMKKEMAIMDCNFCNELRSLKSDHDKAASTMGAIQSVGALPNDKISAARPQEFTNATAEGKDILPTVRALPKAGSAAEKTTTARPASREKSAIRPASRDKTSTKPASQDKTPTGSVSRDKLKTKAKPHPVQQNSPRLVKTSKPTPKKTSK